MQSLSELDGHWEPSIDRGFLPQKDPLVRGSLPYHFEEIEELTAALPILQKRGAFRDAINKTDVIDIPDTLNGQQFDRLMMLYSYLASGYVHAKGQEEAHELPESVAEPMLQLSEKLHRLPILAYWSYCLNNWKKKDPNGPITFDNLELQQYFEDKKNENAFILIHTEIEAYAAKMVEGILHCTRVIEQEGSDRDLWEGLQIMEEAFGKINKTMERMREVCDPKAYWKTVRRYIKPFDQVRFRRTSGTDEVYSLRGETGAQSSWHPLKDTAFGVTHESNALADHVFDMRNYMPPRHRGFIERMANGTSITERVAQSANYVRTSFGRIIDHSGHFRGQHHRGFAKEYILEEEGTELGTGGTVYMPFFDGYIDEEQKKKVPIDDPMFGSDT
jgi:indoleamine 2,3-dioxygenase